MKFYKIKIRINRILKYGLRYQFDSEFRRKKDNIESAKRRKKKYKLGSFRANAKRRKVTLFRRDGNRCHWCTQKMTFKEATLDHIVEVSKGGTHHLNNLRLMHRDCHETRHRTERLGVDK